LVRAFEAAFEIAFGNTTPLDQMASGERGVARVHKFLVRTAMLR
jgi:hypothetical protein